MPDSYFLLDVLNQNGGQAKILLDEENFEENLDDFFDFVLIEPEDIQDNKKKIKIDNQSLKIEKEE